MALKSQRWMFLLQTLLVRYHPASPVRSADLKCVMSVEYRGYTHPESDICSIVHIRFRGLRGL